MAYVTEMNLRNRQGGSSITLKNWHLGVACGAPYGLIWASLCLGLSCGMLYQYAKFINFLPMSSWDKLQEYNKTNNTNTCSSLRRNPNSFDSHDVTVALCRHLTYLIGLWNACNMLCSWLQQQPKEEPWTGISFYTKRIKANSPTIVIMDSIIIVGVVDLL